MAITRVYTDIAPERVHKLVQEIEFDGGTAKQKQQPDGRITLIAEFPDIQPDVAEPPAGSQELKWFSIAKQEIGVKEAVGGADNPRIVEYFATTTLGPRPDSVAWCSAFVNFCITKAGLAGTNNALARSWKDWGRAVPDLVPGCIVVLERTDHVGFYSGTEGGRVVLLGGNQSDAVKLSSFDASRVVARRLP